MATRAIVGIVGAGALGTLVAAALAPRCDVRLLVRDERVEWAIRERGGVGLEGGAIHRVVVSRESAALRDVGLLIVAVKTYATIDAIRPLRDVLSQPSTILSLQNGVDAATQLDRALGYRARVALGPTTEAATWLEPGLVRRAAIGTTHLGWPQDRDPDDDLGAIAALLTRCGLDTIVARPIEPYAWAKLVVNAAINPTTALAGVTNGTVLERADLRERSATLAREAYAVARAAGIALPFADPVAEAERIMTLTAANRSSMLQDLDRGRPTENDAISGAIVRHAREYGIGVPHTQSAYDQIASRESTARA